MNGRKKSNTTELRYGGCHLSNQDLIFIYSNNKKITKHILFLQRLHHMCVFVSMDYKIIIQSV